MNTAAAMNAGKMVASAIAGKRRGRWYKPADFLPTWDRQRTGPQTPEQQLAAVVGITKQLGGNVPKGGDIGGNA